MNCRTDAESNDYLCHLEAEIIPLLCAKFVHIDIMYFITTFKNYVIKINKIPASNKSTKEKKACMLEQLKGIIKAYELVYLCHPDDSDSSSDRSGNGSSDEDFILPISIKK